MSRSLRWRPVNGGGVLGDDLMFALLEGLWSDGGDETEWRTVGRESLLFLRGIAVGAGRARAGDVLKRDALRLIAEIERYGEVEVCIRA